MARKGRLVRARSPYLFRLALHGQIVRELALVALAARALLEELAHDGLGVDARRVHLLVLLHGRLEQLVHLLLGKLLGLLIAAPLRGLCFPALLVLCAERRGRGEKARGDVAACSAAMAATAHGNLRDRAQQGRYVPVAGSMRQYHRNAVPVTRKRGPETGAPGVGPKKSLRDGAHRRTAARSNARGPARRNGGLGFFLHTRDSNAW